jgi:putative SOS response-associated peptidase YedK
MCGRAKLPTDVSELKLDLKIEWDKLGDYRPRWNATPTSDLPVVISTHGERTLTAMRWGLIPSWARGAKISRSTFNARAESLATTPAFRDAWQAGRRCLVVADGYYEWRKPDKQPFAVALGNRGLMTFAGLWDSWRTPDAGTVRSFAIITTRPNALVATIHDRMPVILSSDDWPAWLGEVSATENELKSVLKPYPAERMTLWPVDKRVGNVRNDTPDLFEPLREEATQDHTQHNTANAGRQP